MANVDALTVEVGADIEALKRGLVRLVTEVRQNNAAIEREFARLGETTAREMDRGFQSQSRQLQSTAENTGVMFARTLTAKIVQTVAAGGFAYALQGALSNAADLQRFGEENRLRTGTVTALRGAARAGGVETSTLDSALEKISEISKQTADDAEDFYKALGNVDQAFVRQFQNARSQEERLEVLARAFAKTTDEVQRAQLAQEAFGTDSERLMRVFEQLAPGTDRFRAELERMGISLDEAAVKGAAEAQKQLDALSEALKVNLLNALSAVIGGIQALAARVPAFLRATGIGQPGQDFIRDRGQGDGVLNGRFNSAAAAALLRDQGQPLSQATDFFGAGIPVPIGRPSGAFRARPSLSGGGGGGGGSSGGDRNRANELIEKLRNELALNQAIGTEKAKIEQQERLRRELIALGTSATAEQRAEVERLVPAIAAAKKEEEQRTRVMEAQNALVKEVGGAFTSLFSDLISGGKNAEQAIMNLAKRLADMALQATFLGSGPLADLFGTAPAAGSNKFGGIFGAFANAIFGRASGGSVNAGQVYRVNERGTELFRPNTGGAVVPIGAGMNAAMGGNGGGQPVVVRIENPMGDRQIEGIVRTAVNLAVRQSTAITPGRLQDVGRRT